MKVGSPTYEGIYKMGSGKIKIFADCKLEICSPINHHVKNGFADFKA